MIAASQAQLRGVNMAGGTLPWTSLPPSSGTNYLFASTQDVDYMAAKGVNSIRLLVSWEALQSALNAALGSGGAAYATYLAQMQALVAYATGKGIFVIIEPHGAISSDFCAWKGNAVGTATVPNTTFANFWGQMAAMFASNSLVAFGLGNEPCSPASGGPAGGGGVAAWFTSCNAAIVAIRAAGFTGLIMVPGEQDSCASQWLSNWYDTATTKISNMTGVSAIVDSANNWCISAHQYLNTNNNQDGSTTDIGSSTTIAAASNGHALPQATISVASTAQWTALGATSGRFNIVTSTGAQTVSFTGISGNTFTGCTGGTGTMSTGGAVTDGAFMATRLIQPLITACRAAGVRMHLTEFGVQASSSQSMAACADLAQLLNANQDVCVGMSWWVDGPPSWWGSANFELAPSQGNGSDMYATDSPQMVLAQLFWQGAAQNAAQAAHASEVTAIANAQTTANSANSAAASAATSAAVGITNAAAAQTTANGAATAASAAQGTANTAVTNAATAQTSATAASAAASSAQTTAVTAQAAATAATGGSGPTLSRPAGVNDGVGYVDTDLGGIPITRYAAASTGWINASGTAV